MTRRRTLRTAAATGAFLVFAGLGTGARSADAGGPASGSWILTPAKEAALGERALTEFLAKRRLSENGSLLLRVDRIGRRLAAVSDRPDMSYRFLVVQGKEPQAYSFPGGTVCLTDSAVALFANDDEIAFAVAHELAHLCLRHHAISLRVSQIRDEGQVSDAALLATIQSRFDKASELEADRYGALYAVRAGFAFSGAVAALVKLDRTGVPDANESHPAYASRIDGLTRFRAELTHSIEAFNVGTKALAELRVEAAIDGLTIFVAQFPNSLAGRVNLGAAYLARVRKSSGAPGGLAETLPILPESDVVLRGDLDPVDIEQAGSQFTAALGMNMDHPWAHAGLALVELRRRRIDDARHEIDLARRGLPASPEILLCAGNIEYVVGRFDSALALYDQALALRPAWPAAIKNTSLAHEQRGEAVAARDGWLKLAGDPTYGTEAQTRLQLLSAAPR